MFDRDAMIEALQRSLASKGLYEHGPVDYTLGRFGMSAAASVFLDGFTESNLEDDVAKHVAKHSREFFFLKTEDWASEWEYRFIFREATGEPGEPGQPAEAHFVDFGDFVRLVVVGEKFPEWQLPAAKHVANRAGVELRRMTWEIGRPHPAKIR